MQSVIREEITYTSKELRGYANSYWQKPEYYRCKWILRVLNQGGWNLILDQVEFTDMGALPDILDFMCYL